MNPKSIILKCFQKGRFPVSGYFWSKALHSAKIIYTVCIIFLLLSTDVVKQYVCLADHVLLLVII